MEKMSLRFLQMENKANATEKIHFPTKKLWKNGQDSEDLKFTRALKYIFSEMRYSVPSDPKNLIYLIINVIFFNKTAP